jgi:hypothetical protein
MDIIKWNFVGFRKIAVGALWTQMCTQHIDILACISKKQWATEQQLIFP